MLRDTFHKLFHSICIFLLASLLAACQTSPSTTAPLLQAGLPAEPETTTRLVLKAGDVIEIKFAYAGQLNDTQTIRPDGKMELQLVGEIVAEGKSPSELRDDLIKLYAVQVRHPELAVIVRGLNKRRVYVGGEVNKPGLVDVPGEMTALEAIMQSGGFNLEKAEVRNVIVVRHKDGCLVGHSLDFKEALAGHEAQPFYLQPRDIVYVPRTSIVDIDQWISQHLYKLLPPVGIGATMF